MFSKRREGIESLKEGVGGGIEHGTFFLLSVLCLVLPPFLNTTRNLFGLRDQENL